MSVSQHSIFEDTVIASAVANAFRPAMADKSPKHRFSMTKHHVEH